jgi:putative membrane protein
MCSGSAQLRWQRVERALRLGRPLPAPRLAAVLVVALMVLAAGSVPAALIGSR